MTWHNENFEADSLADLVAQLPDEVAALVLKNPPESDLMRVYSVGQTRCFVFVAPVSDRAAVASLKRPTPWPPTQA